MKKERILIFNVNWLGDVLFSTAAIRNIRRNFPESFLVCAIPSRCYPILKGNPYLDEVIIFDEKDRHKGMLGRLKFVQQLKEKRFDTVFLLHRSLTRTLITRLADIPERVGYYTKKRGFLLTQKIPQPARDSMHRIDYYLNILEKAGLRIEDRHTEFFISDEDIDFVAEILAKNRIGKGDFLVGINPGGNWLPKRWPKAYWSILADKLIEKYQARVVITGGPEDRKLSREIQEAMQQEAISTCGIFNLKHLGALCKRLDLFITADSGPLHIANSVGTKKIIAVFGPTSPEITGPYPEKNTVVLKKDVGCKIPCYLVNCKNNRCMRAITPDLILAEVENLFKQ